MEIDTFLANVSQLSDLELAILLSLTAQQHCLITIDDDFVDELATELSLIVSETFNLSYVVIDSEQQQSVEEFGAAILNDEINAETPASATARSPLTDGINVTGIGKQRSAVSNVNVKASSSSIEKSELDRRMVVNVIIAKNFNFAHRDVQIATLELIQRRRIFSRTTVHPVPKDFLFLPLVTTSSRHIRLNNHLNDRIAISHHHDASGDGFVKLEELEQRSLSDQRSSSSSIEYGYRGQNTLSHSQITLPMIEKLRTLGQGISMTSEIRRYIQDLIVFLRMHRGVDGGISPFASTMCVEITKYLAALHGITYATPDLVALALRKVYPHRIVSTTSDRDRSLQWGSKIEAVTDVLRNMTTDRIIDDVVASVQCPI